MSTPEEVALYTAFGAEIMRRAMAADDLHEVKQWITDHVNLLGGVHETQSLLTWEESFPYTTQLFAAWEEMGRLPEDQRREIRWPWESWNNRIGSLEPGMLAVLTAGDGMGKCLGKGTKVLMFDGTLRNVEDVQIGDLLMGPDSTHRKVLALGRGREQMFWIRQNIGIDYRCNASHLLSLIVRDKMNRKSEQIITAREVAAMPDWYIQRNLQGHKVAVDWPEKEVPLDPYYMGLWLGDGNKRNAMVIASDPEVINWLHGYSRRLGCGIVSTPDNERGTAMRVTVSNGRGGLHLRRGKTPAFQLSELGLISNKHIPQVYIANSEAVRLSLLAGLVDSDGHYDCASKSYEITQKREGLARQIKLVADSLGFSTTIRSKRATIKARGVDTEVWRLTIRGDIERIPVLIPRKRAVPRTINKDWRVTGFTIEPDGEGDYYGFTIDGDHRFLLEDMTVTHNTIFAEMIAEHMTKIGLHCVFVHYELSWPIMMARRATRMTGLTKRDALAGLTPAQRQEIADMRIALERKGSNGYLHTPGWDVEKTIAKLSELHSQQSCDVVVLDYLEKVSSSARQAKMYSSQFQREADTVETLKNWAEAHGVPIVLLSQLSKAGKSATADNLDRTAIRGAGEKTEKANIVVMLHRDKLPADTEGGSRYSDEVTIIVDKNTMGATGTWQMMMQPERFSVGDATPKPKTTNVDLNAGR